MSQFKYDEFKEALKEVICNEDDKAFKDLKEQFMQHGGDEEAWLKLGMIVSLEMVYDDLTDEMKSKDAESQDEFADYTVKAVDAYLAEGDDFAVEFIKHFYDGDISDEDAKALAKELEHVNVLHKDEPDEHESQAHNEQYFKDIIAAGDDAQKLGELFIKHYEDDDIASQLQFNREINETRKIYALVGYNLFDEPETEGFCSSMKVPNLEELAAKLDEIKPLFKEFTDNGMKLFDEKIKPRSKEFYNEKVKPLGNTIKQAKSDIVKSIKHDNVERKSPLAKASEMAEKADTVSSEHDQRVKEAAKQEYLEVLAYMINDKAERGERELILTSIDGKLPVEGLNLSPEVDVLDFNDDIAPELVEAGYTITKDKHQDAVGYIIKW